MRDLIMAIDQGTTGSTVLVIDRNGRIMAKGYQEYPQHYPQPGWVEHDPEDIWSSVLAAIRQALANVSEPAGRLAGIGITNQRETTLAWSRATGEPLSMAIVWQCRRTSEMCATLKARGAEAEVRSRTGLVLDPYFSGTKMRWMLDNVANVQTAAASGDLMFGTVDSFLIYRLTGGKNHVTDVSNASRTLLLNLETLEWDPWLADLFGVPVSSLPRVVDSVGQVGTTSGVPGLPDGIPIAGVAGDQQAALFGQACFTPGEGKITFGTGAFMLVNTGSTALVSNHGLVTTVAWRIGGKATYAFEGSAFIAGAAVQWLRDELQIISKASDIEALALSVSDSQGVVMVPAFTGLGAPHWRPDVRGALVGLTRGANRGHIARATLEGIALQNADIMNAMSDDLGKPLVAVKADGGASANNLLMQLQSDLLNAPVLRPTCVETTGLGAAFLAGMGVGLWTSLDSVSNLWVLDREFRPEAPKEAVAGMVARWKAALEKL